MTLDQIWQELKPRLARKSDIPAWNAESGYLGERYIVVRLLDGFVEVAEPGDQRAKKIPDADFIAVLGVWDGYADGKMKMAEIEKRTDHAKYVVSLLRSLEQQ